MYSVLLATCWSSVPARAVSKVSRGGIGREERLRVRFGVEATDAPAPFPPLYSNLKQGWGVGAFF